VFCVLVLVFIDFLFCGHKIVAGKFSPCVLLK
jgi:hypothetical protein